MTCSAMSCSRSSKPGDAARARESVHDIHAYIQRAFRNRFLDAKRAAARREQRDARATSSADATGERVMLASCSEGSLRASAGDATRIRSSTSRRAIARLASVLDAELSASERQMLTWVSNAVPMREIATWLEIGYSAAKVRLSRTRRRLRAARAPARERVHGRRARGADRLLSPQRRRDAGSGTSAPARRDGRDTVARGRTWRSTWRRLNSPATGGASRAGDGCARAARGARGRARLDPDECGEQGVPRVACTRRARRTAKRRASRDGSTSGAVRAAHAGARARARSSASSPRASEPVVHERASE